MGKLKTFIHTASNNRWLRQSYLLQLSLDYINIIINSNMDKIFQTYRTIFSIFFGVLTIFNLADGLMFHLEPNSRKCLKEEIHKGVLVTGDYDANQIPNQVVDLMVIDTKGQHFVNRESTDTGKFAFTTDDYDVYEICFLSRVPPSVRGQGTKFILMLNMELKLKIMKA